MKISELSEVELSRWIAEKNEPNPTFIVANDWWISNGRMWISHTYTSAIRTDAEPRDYQEPDIALRLLRDIVGKIDVTMLHRASLGGKSNYFVCPTIRGFLDIPDSLERAIAETWALQNGWQE